MAPKKLLLVSLLSGLSLLAACDGSSSSTTTKPQEPTPASFEATKVFDEAWGLFDRYYPLMHRKGIDWLQVQNEQRIKITDATTESQLQAQWQDILQTIIKDGHVSITTKDKELGYEPGMDENLERMLQDNTDKQVTYLGNSAIDPYLSYGYVTLAGGIGYVKSKGFEPENDNDNEYGKFQKSVNAALDALQDKEAIIVDVRTNGGGQGHFAYYLAGRFMAPGDKQVVRKRIKVTTGSTESSLGGWITELFEGYRDARVKEGGYAAGSDADLNSIAPSGSYQYTKPVYLLTSGQSASSAEYFTVAMKTQPHVTSIGTKTFGIFAGSDTFTLNSAPSWQVRVSTEDVEVFYKGEFVSLEGKGIPADVAMTYPKGDIDAGKDLDIDKAISLFQASR